MQIDILRTPRLLVTSPSWTHATLDEQITSALSEVEAFPSVTAARTNAEAAATEVERLNKRQAELNATLCELHKRLAGHRDHFRDKLIADKPLGDDAVAAHGKDKASFDGCSEAIKLLIEDLIPAAHRRRLRADADYLRAQEAAILQVATTRAKRIVDALAAVADAEGCVEVDVGRTPVIADLLTRRERCFDVARTNEKYLETLSKGKQ